MTRLTQKQAANIVRDPGSVFEGARVHLENNYGRLEIVVHDDRGPSFRVSISKGPAGIGASIQHCAGSGPLSISGNTFKDWEPLPRDIEAFEIDAMIYAQDDYSQDFKHWYHAKDRAVNPPERNDYDERGMRKA